MYTVSRCDSCDTDSKERFAPGDYIYKTAECTKCEGTTVIRGIFGQEQSG